jgi:ABC-type multidrug transport system fused ATPase/permease subunit
MATCEQLNAETKKALNMIQNISQSSSKIPSDFHSRQVLKEPVFYVFLVFFFGLVALVLLLFVRSRRRGKKPSRYVRLNRSSGKEEEEEEQGSNPMKVKFRNLGLKLNSGKQVLYNVNGSLNPGEITAIMGPSGTVVLG